MCKISKDDMLYIDDMRHKLDWKPPVTNTNMIIWLPEIPILVSCFVWRANRGHIPSADALLQIGVKLESNIFGYFKRTEETVEHVLFSCSFATNF